MHTPIWPRSSPMSYLYILALSASHFLITVAPQYVLMSSRTHLPLPTTTTTITTHNNLFSYS